jgi:hypothetical protein
MNTKTNKEEPVYTTSPMLALFKSLIVILSSSQSIIVSFVVVKEELAAS